jgi:hypothetical protein
MPLRQWVKSSHQGGFSATVWQEALPSGVSEKSFKFKYFMFVIYRILRHAGPTTAKGADACVRQF